MIEQQPFLWWRVLDESGTRGTQRVYIQRAGINAAQSAGAGLRSVFRAMSGCSYLEQQLVLPAVELFPAPAAGSDVRICALFVFGCATPEQYALISIGGIRPELIMQTGCAAGVNIDTSAPAVAALIAELTSGRYCNQFGHTITQLAAAFVRHEYAYIPGGFLPS